MIEPGAVVAVRSATAYRDTSLVSRQTEQLISLSKIDFFADIAGHHTSTCKKQLKVPFDDHNCIIVILQKTSLPRTRAEIVSKFISGFTSEYRKLFHKMSVLLCSQTGGPRIGTAKCAN